MNALQTMEAVHIYVRTPQVPVDAAVGLELGFLAMEDRVFQLDLQVLVQLDLLWTALCSKTSAKIWGKIQQYMLYVYTNLLIGHSKYH